MSNGKIVFLLLYFAIHTHTQSERDTHTLHHVRWLHYLGPMKWCCYLLSIKDDEHTMWWVEKKCISRTEKKEASKIYTRNFVLGLFFLNPSRA